MSDFVARYIATANTKQFMAEMRKMREAMRALKAESEGASASYESSQDDMADATARSRKEQEASLDATKKTSAVMDDVASATRGASEATEDKARVSEDAASADRDHATSAREVTTSVTEMSSAERDLHMVTLRRQKAQADLTVAQERYEEVSRDTTSTDRDRFHAELNVLDAMKRLEVSTKNLTTETTRYKATTHDTSREMEDNRNQGALLSKVFTNLGGEMRQAKVEASGLFASLKAFAIPAIVGLFNSLVGVIDQLAAGLLALIPALSRVIGLLGAIPGLVAAAGAGISTILLSFIGLGDAIGALSDAQSQSAEAAEQQSDQAQAVADAQQNLRDTYYSTAQSMESATESLADAFENQRDAEDALTQAHEDARRALEDLRMESERADLSAEGARLSLIRARRNLRELQGPDASPTDLDYREAVLAVQEAELNLKDAQQNRIDTREELTEAEEKGIKQSDIVVDAQENLARANEAVADAQESMASTARANARAMEAAKEALSDAREQAELGSSSQQKLAEAMEGLSPAAKQFARTIVGLKPKLDELRQAAQTGLLPGLEDAIVRLTDKYFPALKSTISDIAQSMGGFFSRLGRQMSSSRWQTIIVATFEDARYIVERFNDSLLSLNDGFGSVALAARPLTRWVADLVAQFSLWFQVTARAGQESGRMTEWFESVMETTEQLGRILSDLGRGIYNFFKAGSDAGQQLWDLMEGRIEEWADWTESIDGQNSMKDWFDRSVPFMREFMRLLGGIIDLWNHIADRQRSAATGFVTSLTDQMLPALQRLSDSVTETLVPQLVRMASALIDVLAIFGNQGGTLDAFLKTINAILETFVYIVNTIPGFKTLLGYFFLLNGAAKGLVFIGKILKLAFFAPFGTLIPQMGKLVAATKVFVKMWRDTTFLTAIASVFPGLIISLQKYVTGLVQATAATAGLAKANAGLQFSLRYLGSVVGPVAALAAAFVALLAVVSSNSSRMREYVGYLKEGTQAQKDFVRATAAQGVGEMSWADRATLVGRSEPFEAIVGASDVGEGTVSRPGIVPGAGLGPFGTFLNQLSELRDLERETADQAVYLVDYLGRVTTSFKQGNTSLGTYVETMALAERGTDGAAISNEEFARIFNQELLPALIDGSLQGDAYDQAMQLAADHGIDAAAAVAAYHREVAETVRAHLQGREAMSAWGDVLRRNVDLTNEQRAALGDLLTQVYEYGGGLSFVESAYLAYLIATDQGEKAQRKLNSAILDGRVRFEDMTDEQRTFVANDALKKWADGNSESLRGFERITGDTFASFRQGAADAFATSGTVGLETFVGNQIDSLKALRDAYRENFDGIGSVLQEFSGDLDISAAEAEEALSDQQSLIDDYSDDWDTFMSKNPPKWLVNELKAMGLDGAGWVEMLADTNGQAYEDMVGDMQNLKDSGIELADTVNAELSSAIDRLIAVLKKLPTWWRMNMAIDTSGVRADMRSLFIELRKKGFTPVQAFQATNNIPVATEPTDHIGGEVGKETHFTRGKKRSDEVDVRALKGEYVLSREAVRAAGGPQVVDRAHRRLRSGARRRRLERSGVELFHTGGLVGRTRRARWEVDPDIDTEFVESGLGVPVLASGLKDTTGVAALKGKLMPDPARWEQPFDASATGGGGTPAMNALNNWVHQHFNVSGGPTVEGPDRTINFQPGAALSQHAYGNASDYSGTAEEMARLFRSIVRAAMSRTIRTLGHAIFNYKSWSYNDQNVGYYPGSDVNPHTDHVHVDALPQWGNGWPGSPVGSSHYHRGGYVNRPGTVHTGEYVLRPQVVDALTVPSLDWLNTFGDTLGPEVLMGDIGRPPSSGPVKRSREPVAMGGDHAALALTMELDGRSVSRTVDIYSKKAKVRLPAR